MSLRYLSKANDLLIVPVLVLGLCAPCANAWANPSSVQTYVDEAVPPEIPAAETPQNAPLAAGALTLEDVLKAHPRTAPQAPVLPSTSGMMLSEGLKSVLQKVGPSALAPVRAQASKAPASLPQVQPETAKEPGSSPVSATAGTAAPATEQPCSQNIQKWEKSCGEAGYPASFVGKVSGETRSSCSDGTLNDVWVANTCAPPSEALAQATTTLKTSTETAKAEETSAPASRSEEASAQTAPVPAVENKVEEQQGFVGDILSYLFGSSSVAPEHTSEKPSMTAIAEAPDLPVTPSPPTEDLNSSNELCGAAAEMMAYEAPGKNLCRAGIASAVSGNGPWTWSCTSNKGAISTCKTLSLGGEGVAGPAASSTTHFLKPPTGTSASKAASAKLACGAASGQPAQTIPVFDLCQGGKASVVRGSNPWKWTCAKGKKKVSCATIKSVDGVCGTSNEKPATTAPSKNLCKKGTAGSVSGDGPWTWTCSGSNGGSQASCSAPRLTPSETVIPKASKTNTPISEFLDKKPAPVPAPAKSFAKIPAPSSVPEAADVTGDVTPVEVPVLSEDSEPLPPPAVRDVLPPAPALKEAPVTATSTAPVTRLVLDPTISTILFTRGSATIEERVLITLDKLVAALKQNPAARISLIAYADDVGSTKRAVRQLSLNRALAVRDYLSSKGIPESRVDIHAEGADTSPGYADRVNVKVND